MGSVLRSAPKRTPPNQLVILPAVDLFLFAVPPWPTTSNSPTKSLLPSIAWMLQTLSFNFKPSNIGSPLKKTIMYMLSYAWMALTIGSKGFNPALIVLLLVGGLLLIFLVGNYVLYTYAQKTLPPRKKKPISKKKMKKERLKQGVSAPGE
ncbi:DNA-binding protein S1FA2 [Glycine soja]